MDLRAKITDAVYDHHRADDQINAVMEVVEGEIERRAVLVCTDERHKTRVQELEEENTRLRADLEHATRLEFPRQDAPDIVVELDRFEDGGMLWSVADENEGKLYREYSATTEGRDAALARARDIAKEEK